MMLNFSRNRVISRYPRLKVLALSFLLLIGAALIAESLGLHIPKGYLYFAMAFSIFVEILNMVTRKMSSTGRQPPANDMVDEDEGMFVRGEN